MTIYSNCWQDDECFYMIDLNWSDYKFALLPMVFITAFSNLHYTIQIGFLSLQFEFTKAPLHVEPKWMKRFRRILDGMDEEIKLRQNDDSDDQPADARQDK